MHVSVPGTVQKPAPKAGQAVTAAAGAAFLAGRSAAKAEPATITAADERRRDVSFMLLSIFEWPGTLYLPRAVSTW